MADMQMTFTNLNAFVADLRKQYELTAREAAGAVYEVCEDIMADSKANFVPVETGLLRSTGYVNEPVIEHGRVYVELGYGGAADAYALIQHERLDFHHKVGQAKYLETPMNNAAANLDERLAARMARR